MHVPILADVSPIEIVLFGILVLGVFLAFFALCIFGIRLAKWQSEGSLSPYSRTPLRRCIELSYQAKLNVLRYLFSYHQYDNRIFEFKRSSFCRETGRIFPDSITWYDVIKVDWSFLQKRYPGTYVSWGSLSGRQKEIIASIHESLEGFQVELSSTHPMPRSVEAQYAFAKPGPLYVDIETNILLGWKCVPDTELEVLIVQKPLQYHMPTI